MKERWRSTVISSVVALGLGAVAAWAAQTNYLGTIFIADSTVPTRQLQVNSDGSINATVISGAAVPGGSNTQVQYNNNGAFGGITGVTTDGTNLTLGGPLSFNYNSMACTFQAGSLSDGTDINQLDIVCNSPENAVSIVQQNATGFAALTFRGKDHYFSDPTKIFEHGAIGWIPGFNTQLGNATGGTFIEASRFDGSNSGLVPPPAWFLFQTGGVDATGGSNVTCATTINSTTVTCTGNGGAIGTAMWAVTAGNLNIFPPSTTVSSGGGTVNIVASAQALSTNAAVTVNFSTPVWLQRTVIQADPLGGVHLKNWDASTGLFVDRFNKRIGIEITTPTQALDVNGGINASAAIITGGFLVFSNGNLGLQMQSGTTFLVSTGAATINLGQVASATPIAQTLRVQGATGVDTAAAATFTLLGPLGTGAGNNGDVVAKTGTKVGSGSGAPTQTIALTIKGETQEVDIATRISVGVTGLTLTTGAYGLAKITASASAPGAAGGKLELVCGTNAGSAKLIIAAGTSATAVTVVDNVGSGVTGC